MGPAQQAGSEKGENRCGARSAVGAAHSGGTCNGRRVRLVRDGGMGTVGHPWETAVQRKKSQLAPSARRKKGIITLNAQQVALKEAAPPAPGRGRS